MTLVVWEGIGGGGIAKDDDVVNKDKFALDEEEDKEEGGLWGASNLRLKMAFPESSGVP